MDHRTARQQRTGVRVHDGAPAQREYSRVLGERGAHRRRFQFPEPALPIHGEELRDGPSGGKLDVLVGVPETDTEASGHQPPHCGLARPWQTDEHGERPHAGSGQGVGHEVLRGRWAGTRMIGAQGRGGARDLTHRGRASHFPIDIENPHAGLFFWALSGLTDHGDAT
ncbi:hypothetical protein GCM10010261_61600 [Streptomyces pilosus]|uniref:Uncharacterized protein n=1 Tax=Streptomyces pilosus TaxID=28893 RepID=A0A918C459_9ACTN|nr:hypothetical protein GCM10010280_60380 [Streptomyces pilosus]GGV68135.1 hypothetical protein GCM10010261_61600 [Streptomyces pilosus]